jgi:anthraniloyl-CoA monooxygenase
VKIAIIGGGPGGLYLASLVGERVPGVEIAVYERNAPLATYGFGVVFSEPTMRNLRDQDPQGFESLFKDAARWPGIDINIKSDVWRCEGNGFSAIERRQLLRMLAERAEAAGVALYWDTTITADSPELKEADVVVVANGANTDWRTHRAAELGSSVETASAKFIWFGATHVFDGMTFLFEENKHGWFAVHAYPYNTTASTFVVETDEETWRNAGLDAFDTNQPPGPSDLDSARYCEKLFGEHLGGAKLITNNSRWSNFRTVRTRDWVLDDRSVLLGDAAHTAHFSVGSGTKMAMEDALCLANEIAAVSSGEKTVPAALKAYEAERRSEVRKIQDVARPSLSWWEHFGEYAQMAPAQFATHFLTRSGRVGRERLQRSDPDFADRALTDILGDPSASALRVPMRLGEVAIPTRLVGLSTEPSKTAEHPAALTAGVSTASDLRADASVGVGSTTLFTDTGENVDALWVRAPATLDGIAAFLDDHESALSNTTTAIIDVARVDETDRNALVEAQVVQQRISEIVRLRLGNHAVLVRRQATADEAATLIISGRADAIAISMDNVAAVLAEDESAHTPTARTTTMPAHPTVTKVAP